MVLLQHKTHFVLCPRLLCKEEKPLILVKDQRIHNYFPLGVHQLLN